MPPRRILAELTGPSRYTTSPGTSSPARSTTMVMDSPGRRERERGQREYIPSSTTGMPSTVTTESPAWKPASSSTLPGRISGMV